MQFQADLCGVDVVRPKVIETTALGAAYAAGMAVGYWSGTDDVVANWQEGKRWTPPWSRPSATARTACGRRPSRGRSTGLTTT